MPRSTNIHPIISGACNETPSLSKWLLLPLKVSHFLPPDPLPARQDSGQKADKPVLFVVIITRANHNLRARKNIFRAAALKKRSVSPTWKLGWEHFVLSPRHCSQAQARLLEKRELRQKEIAFQTSDKWRVITLTQVLSIYATEAYRGSAEGI